MTDAVLSARSRPPTGCIKGAAFREFLAWYAEQHRADLTRAVARLPQGALKELDPEAHLLGVIASRWYSAASVHALLDALTESMTDIERVKLAFSGSRAVMRHTLRGVYRVLFRLMASPERYAKHAPKLWSAYYDSGRFAIELTESNATVTHISAWAAHHPFICELNWGAARVIYEAMGCREVNVERKSCVDLGDSECCFVSRWAAAP